MDGLGCPRTLGLSTAALPPAGALFLNGILHPREPIHRPRSQRWVCQLSRDPQGIHLVLTTPLGFVGPVWQATRPYLQSQALVMADLVSHISVSFFPARNWSLVINIATVNGYRTCCGLQCSDQDCTLKMRARAMLCLITHCQLHTPGPHLDATILPFILLTQYDHSHQHILPDDSRSSSPRCGSHLTLRLHPSNSSSVLVSHILVRLL